MAEVKAEGEESGASLMEEVEKLIEAIDETAAYVLE